MADIFISYTSGDRDWAFWIAKTLETLGHTPHVHEWEIKAGENIYVWMQKRHDEADHVLCVLSDEYLDRVKAPYSAVERDAAFWQAAGKRPGFVLLVAVKPFRMPTLADHYRRCELYGISDEAARIRFRDFMDRRDAPSFAFPGQQFAVSNIPIRVPTHFLGRDDSLAAIEAALKRHEGRVAITALHGLRGVGKTTLAAAYAERHRGAYRATWWIRAQTEITMRADIVGIGVRLKWVAPDEKEEPALTAVMERLRHEGLGIILIFDSAPDAAAITSYLPLGGSAQVLITSNARAWRGVAAPVEIRVWPLEIGADFLIVRTGREGERLAAEALSSALGGLPLAHEQAAAYCERLEVTLAEYHKRFEAAPVQSLENERDTPAEYHNRLTVAKTFALAIERAVRIHPAAELLIVHAALLAPEPIPLFLFAETREKFGEPLAAALAGDGLEDILAALRVFALVDREIIPDERDPSITTETIRLHPLVREVAAARREGDLREGIRRALIDSVAAVYPDDVHSDSKVWPRARRIDALALGLVGGDVPPPKGAELCAAELANGLAAYRRGALGSYPQAQFLCERALAIRERAFGPEHPETANGLNELGLLLKDQADFVTARSLYERALTIYERALGPEHPRTATSLNNLAILLRDQGDVARAVPLVERALSINEKTLGLEHSDTIRALGNLSRLLQTQGDFAKAQLLYERALATSEKVHGPEHPDTATGLANLANLFQNMGDLEKALPLNQRAVAIYEKVLGPEHPHTATGLNNLACLLRDMGQRANAEPLFCRAIAIAEKALGAEHPITQRYQSQYTRLLLITDRAMQALQVGQVALATHKHVLGPAHAWTKDSAGVTADALAALGRGDEAVALREKYGINNQNSA